MTKSPLLTIDHLTIRFGDTSVVSDVNLRMNPGEILALVGESGSGKSLTAQAILQLLPPEAATSGTITFEEKTISDASPRAIRALRGNRIGMIFQEPMSALNPLHPIQKQIVESYCWHQHVSPRSMAAKNKLTELLKAVGLDHLVGRGKLYPHQLSGGERQRAMIAMAIANDPVLLIADEPTTALDVTLQQQILQLLKDLQASRNMSMLFISHDLTAVRKFADRVAVMHHGTLVEQGTTQEIFSAPKQEYTRALINATPQGNAVPIAADAVEILHTEKLSVRFPIQSPIMRRTVGHVDAVSNVSIQLRAGETLGIVGESGSGKSSLAYAILRLVKSEGPIVFLGQRLDHMHGHDLRKSRRDFQPVFQDPYGSLNPRMTVGEIIAEGLRLHEPKTVNYESRVDEILTQVGLTPEMKHRYPHAFSGGQRQRIAIARAMVLKPKLVVLDEPTSALDLSVQATVLALLKALQATHQVAYLFISHDLRVIRSVAHQVLVLKRGQVVEQGETQKLFASAQHAYTKALLSAALVKKSLASR